MANKVKNCTIPELYQRATQAQQGVFDVATVEDSETVAYLLDAGFAAFTKYLAGCEQGIGVEKAIVEVRLSLRDLYNDCPDILHEKSRAMVTMMAAVIQIQTNGDSL